MTKQQQPLFMLQGESNGALGLPKCFRSFSLLTMISSLGHLCYELYKLIQYLVGGNNKTSNFLNSNVIHKREKKTHFTKPTCYIHISNNFRNYADLQMLMSANTRNSGSR